MNQIEQQPIQVLRGMRDSLPSEANHWSAIENILKAWCVDYGYQRINLPIIESTQLFLRTLGETSDIVEKEMFTFTDTLNSKSVTLRPEGTASCVRAVLNSHALRHQPMQRLWYYGSMFRHERPQKGRYREFCQIGLEALGMEGPDIDAELILMTKDLWQRLGILDNLVLQINSIGTADERSAYRQALVDYLLPHCAQLDQDSQRRLATNPLRILDSKDETTQALCQRAPRLMDYLGDRSLEHYHAWKKMLDALQIHYVENPNLVRGLDYYNFSVLEWVTTSKGAQNTVCAGGRYDQLMSQLGGKATPAAGLAIGIERVLQLVDHNNQWLANIVPDIYLIQKGEEASLHALCIANTLRQAGYHVLQHMGQAKFAYQFKQANLSGARFAIVLGEHEMAQHTVTIKPLLEAGKPQQTVQQTDLMTTLKALCT
ncbi:MAG: histidine--tRNA ligase [Neisseriales bacterium]|nr:MAG: histidine--tRNA ligase [Neisseriales bacterium]